MSSLWFFVIVLNVIWLAVWRLSVDLWRSPRARGLVSLALAVGITVGGAIGMDASHLRDIDPPPLYQLPSTVVAQLAVIGLLYIRGVKPPFSRQSSKTPDVVSEERSPIEHTSDDGSFLCDVIDAQFGSTRGKQASRAGLRVAHSAGSGAKGCFYPDPAARELTTAEIFAEIRPVAALARFSNFHSPKERNDEAPGPRGLALRLTSDVTSLDIVAISIDRFVARNREDFVSFSRAMSRPPYVKYPWLLYLLIVGRARTGVLWQLLAARAPESYLDPTYHGINAFWFKAPDGTETPIRYRIVPTERRQLDQPVARGRCRLDRDLGERLKAAASFDVLAVRGDGLNIGRINDPLVPWPRRSRAVRLGTLVLDKPYDTEKLAFNPHNLCRGIRPSDDEILMARRAAYPTSVARRLDKTT